MARAHTGFAIVAIGATFCVSIADAGIFSFLSRPRAANSACSEATVSSCDGQAPPTVGTPNSTPPPPVADAEDAPATPHSALPSAAPAPVLFAAPTPTGEITGSRSSFELPSVRMTLPKIALETPSLRLNGGARVRRNPQMDIDGAVAGVASGPPIVHGPLLGAGYTSAAQSRTAAPQAAPKAAAQDAPAGTPSDSPADDRCVDPCTLREQQEEVRQLTQQVEQLQGILLQLTESQAVKKDTDDIEQEGSDNDVSYIEPKTRTVAYQTSRHLRSSGLGRERQRQLQQEEELAALEAETALRQEEIEDGYAQKVAELEEMQARMERLQLEQKRLLEAKLKKIDSERERRLRTRSFNPASKRHQIVQSSSEYEAVDEDFQQPVAPNKLSRPSNMKPIPPASRRSKSVSSDYDDSDGIN